MAPIDKGFEKPEDFFDEKTRDLNISIKADEPAPLVSEDLATKIVKPAPVAEPAQIPEATVRAQAPIRKPTNDEKHQRTGKSFALDGENSLVSKFNFIGNLKIKWLIVLPVVFVLAAAIGAFYYLKSGHTKVQNPELLEISRPSFELSPHYDTFESFNSDLEELYSKAK